MNAANLIENQALANQDRTQEDERADVTQPVWQQRIGRWPSGVVLAVAEFPPACLLHPGGPVGYKGRLLILLEYQLK